MRISNVNKNRKSVFVGEMPDETLRLEFDGKTQDVRVLGRFCVRTEFRNNNYVVVFPDDAENPIIFRWNNDSIEIITDKKEWDIVLKTWESILSTVKKEGK